MTSWRGTRKAFVVEVTVVQSRCGSGRKHGFAPVVCFHAAAENVGFIDLGFSDHCELEGIDSIYEPIRVVVEKLCGTKILIN